MQMLANALEEDRRKINQQINSVNIPSSAMSVQPSQLEKSALSKRDSIIAKKQSVGNLLPAGTSSFKGAKTINQ